MTIFGNYTPEEVQSMVGGAIALGLLFGVLIGAGVGYLLGRR